MSRNQSDFCSWDRSCLSIVYTHFYLLPDLVCKSFMKDFCVYVHKECGSVVSYLEMSSPGFGIGIILPHKMSC